MSENALFISKITDGQASIENALKPAGFFVDRLLSSREAHAFIEGLDNSSSGVCLSLLWRESPTDTHPINESSMKGLLIEMLIHQLENIVRDQESVTATLLDLLKLDGPEASELFGKQLTLLHEGAILHARLLDSISDITYATDEDSCLLLEAVQKAQQVLAASLVHRRIQLEISVAPDIALGVSLQVMILVLCNVICNSKDAIGDAREAGANAGKVRILAELQDDAVLCHVVDDGCGISTEVMKNIFDYGVTTKTSRGMRKRGSGLPLSRRLISESGGSIELTHPGPGQTTFTMKIPTAKKEYDS